MMLISKLLKSAAPNPELEGMLRKYMTFLDPEGKYPMPTIKVVSRSGVRWLGLCNTKFRVDPNSPYYAFNSEILIQKGMLEHLKHLESVVAHEVVHHIVWCRKIYQVPIQQAYKMVKEHQEHGPDFFEVAAEVNQKFGENFVTQTSDLSDIDYKAKEVFLAVVYRPNKPAIWTWMPKPSQDLMFKLEDWEASGGKVWAGTTTDINLATPGLKFPKWGEARQEVWAQRVEKATQGENQYERYAHGDKQVKPKTVARWLVMVKTRRGWINAAVSKSGTIPAREKQRLLELMHYGMDIRAMKLNEEWLDLLPSTTVAANSWLTNSGLSSDGVERLQEVLEFMYNNAKPLT